MTLAPAPHAAVDATGAIRRRRPVVSNVRRNQRCSATDRKERHMRPGAETFFGGAVPLVATLGA